MRRPGRGFTLLELTVTLLVTGLILLLAVQMLAEMQAALVEWQRRAPDPIPQFAVQMLRTDIQRSRLVSSAPGDGPLRLDLPDGSWIVYDSFLGELVRQVVAADGTPRGRRVLLRGVRAWSWHDSLAPGLIEVQVVFRRHRDPGQRRLGNLRRIQDPGERLESVTVRFTQRARPGRRMW